MASVSDFVTYIEENELDSYDLQDLTGEGAEDYTKPFSENLFMKAVIKASSDFINARNQNVTFNTLWEKFEAHLWNMTTSNLDDLKAVNDYFKAKYKVDYPDTPQLCYIYSVLFECIIAMFVYRAYQRVESEEIAKDKLITYKQMMYDIIGKAALTPDVADPLEFNTQAANNTSGTGAIEQGDFSTTFLNEFSDLEGLSAKTAVDSTFDWSDL